MELINFVIALSPILVVLLGILVFRQSVRRVARQSDLPEQHRRGLRDRRSGRQRKPGHEADAPGLRRHPRGLYGADTPVYLCAFPRLRPVILISF